MRTEARAINCASCGAGQSVLGGGRIKTHVCGYCGAAMDASAGFRLVAKFDAIDRPETPFRIGAEGEIAGVPVTVIGIQVVEERWDGKVATWVDHQLYSPTHGYAWLTLENGHLVLTRKERRAPWPNTLTLAEVETYETPPRVKLGEERFRYFESGRHRVTHVAGSFNFTPVKDQVSEAVSCMSRDRMLTYRRMGGELEWEVSQLLDRDAVLRSFGIDPADTPRARGLHPLTPFARSPILGDLRNIAMAGAAACFVLMLTYGNTGGGQHIAESTRQNIDQALSLPFQVADASQLVEITVVVDRNLTNAWAWFDIEVLDDGDEPVATVERGVEFYEGYSDGYWSEGSRYEEIFFRVPEPGPYTLEIAKSEDGTWGRGKQAKAESYWVVLREGHGSGMPGLWGTLGFAFIAFSLIGQRIIHHMRRWGQSDWSDD
ncbi:MAG: DUF4178 domain-containing protein [Pseudomonadota bacterium]